MFEPWRVIRHRVVIKHESIFSRLKFYKRPSNPIASLIRTKLPHEGPCRCRMTDYQVVDCELFLSFSPIKITNDYDVAVQYPPSGRISHNYQPFPTVAAAPRLQIAISREEYRFSDRRRGAASLPVSPSRLGLSRV